MLKKYPLGPVYVTRLRTCFLFGEAVTIQEIVAENGKPKSPHMASKPTDRVRCANAAGKEGWIDAEDLAHEKPL